jgi:hypothetical protein
MFEPPEMGDRASETQDVAAVEGAWHWKAIDRGQAGRYFDFPSLEEGGVRPGAR